MSQLDSKDLTITAIQTENAELKRSGKPAATGTGIGPDTGADVAGGERVLHTETVGSDLLFEPGKATLTTGGTGRLTRIASMLKSRYPGATVRVYGYTDSDPIKKTRSLWSDNLDLSANRAMAVTRLLWSKGIAAASVETVAMGATHFVAPNAAKTDKAKNRRVVIKVVKR